MARFSKKKIKAGLIKNLPWIPSRGATGTQENPVKYGTKPTSTISHGHNYGYFDKKTLILELFESLEEYQKIEILKCLNDSVCVYAETETER